MYNWVLNPDSVKADMFKQEDGRLKKGETEIVDVKYADLGGEGVIKVDLSVTVGEESVQSKDGD